MNAQVYRADAVEVRQDGIDPLTGFWRGEATIAKVGVYEYSDGTKTWREYVPASTLSDENWLRSMSMAPVTVNHPPELVNADNVKRFSVGNTGSEVEFEDDCNETDLVVQDGDAVAAVQRGMREVSCGYLAALDWTAGTWLDSFGVSHPYDAIQTQRIGNHLALTDRGRQGASVSLRGDSAVFRGDGAAWMVPMADKTAEMQAKLDAAEAKTSELQAKCDAALAKADALQAQVDGHPAAVEAAKADGIAQGKAFAVLEAQAKTVCGDAYKADGKDVLQIKRDMLDKLGVKLPDDRKDSADYVAARLDAALESRASQTTADIANARSATRADSGNLDEITQLVRNAGVKVED